MAGFQVRRAWWSHPGLLPAVFALLVTPTILIQVFLTPPMQVADEGSHFLRAAQIARGELLGRKIGDGSAGGDLDPGTVVLARAFDDLMFRPEAKISASAYGVASSLRWGGPVAPASFSNTAVYPFFLYGPGSTGLAIGRGVGLSIMNSFYLGRLLTALASAALCCLAIGLCGQGRATVFIILSVPMATSLFASTSQDAMSIALAAVAAALWARRVARSEAMPAGERTLVALALGAVAATRLPLAPLTVLACMPTRRPARMGRPALADVAAACAGLLPLAIGIFGAVVAKVTFRAEAGVDPVGQIHWLMSHPGSVVTIAADTLRQTSVNHLREMVGILGWIDTFLPPRFYGTVGISVLLAVALDGLAPRVFLPRWGWLPLIAVVLAVAGVFGALYLIWTPVGAPVVEGVQGRYFLAPALVLAVAIPGFNRGLDPRALAWVETARVGLCCFVAATELWVVPITLLHRYYG